MAKSQEKFTFARYINMEPGKRGKTLHMMQGPGCWGGHRYALPTCKIAEINSCIDAFAENIDRATSISMVLLIVSGLSWLYGGARGTVSDKDLEKITELDHPLFDGKQNFLGCAMQGGSLLEHLETQCPQALKSGLKEMCAAQLIALWTAFEAFATDLWIAAVNSRPKSLGINALLLSKKASDTTLPTQRKNPISLDRLVEYDFDLKSRLGNYIHRHGQFGFNTLNDLRAAYYETFCVRKGDRKFRSENVKNWFRGEAMNELTVLEATRHALVHRAGIADASFIERVAKLDAELSTLKVGDPIPADAPTTKAYCDVVILRGRILIDGVIAWFKQPE